MTTEEKQSAENAPHYDIIVIGGGAAGLAGALTLGRARRSVLVVDAGQPRNASAEASHNYLTRDGVPPAELLAAGRAEVAGYGGEFVAGEVVAAESVAGGGFRVVLGSGATARARRLLVTSGLVDELPDVPGLAGRWGRDVLHCPYCHGYEVRDRAIGVLSTGPMGVRQALLWRQWSAEVRLFLHTGPEPTDEQYEQLAARGIAVVDGEVSEVEITGWSGAGDDRISGVKLAGGTVVPCEALVVAPRFDVCGKVIDSLGLEVAGKAAGDGSVLGRHVVAEPGGATRIPGVWVAGNVADPMAKVSGATAMGVHAATEINFDLVEEDTRRAVEVRRRGQEAA
ncbi:putative FAD-dependent pyridine nucleotide-disulfide oxidoreductase [Streptomyces chrestomyceticus JCM 4735]|uniref:FAD-dependent pyridine nucleotide-disulfide oxidoreductase n=1 Tax=Streptomyces chrestomyceticus JCM 4735 TaxID=1306181 RepID=A0A7U9KX03_9ACTN|nr:NAD(P)/FAD-dependent oxidoreductase [Streptomyces chrestomyceticus]GCD36957.1 putative FAD-dependent pyridine nucleotide-disulfide oxidoreductase [Streptomyces chrestomyceticus JCM 4735]